MSGMPRGAFCIGCARDERVCADAVVVVAALCLRTVRRLGRAVVVVAVVGRAQRGVRGLCVHGTQTECTFG